MPDEPEKPPFDNNDEEEEEELFESERNMERILDYLDLFAAPDETVAAKVVVIIRSFGHAPTETWTALPWERFAGLIPA